jgi:hypothetical protein
MGGTVAAGEQPAMRMTKARKKERFILRNMDFPQIGNIEAWRKKQKPLSRDKGVS